MIFLVILLDDGWEELSTDLTIIKLVVITMVKGDENSLLDSSFLVKNSWSDDHFFNIIVVWNVCHGESRREWK